MTHAQKSNACLLASLQNGNQAMIMTAAEFEQAFVTKRSEKDRAFRSNGLSAAKTYGAVNGRKNISIALQVFQSATKRYRGRTTMQIKGKVFGMVRFKTFYNFMKRCMEEGCTNGVQRVFILNYVWRVKELYEAANRQQLERARRRRRTFNGSDWSHVKRKQRAPTIQHRGHHTICLRIGEVSWLHDSASEKAEVLTLDILNMFRRKDGCDWQAHEGHIQSVYEIVASRKVKT